MSISTLAELKTSITNWSKRSDLSAYHDDLILVAEKWIFRHARVRSMETALSGTISSGVLAVPSDYLALKHARITGSEDRRLTMKAADWIYTQYPTRSSDAKPYFIAVDGSSFIFGPYPDSDYPVAGRYYAQPTSILSGVTTFFTDNADLYLWASLTELEPFLKNDKRIDVWRAKRDMVLGDANNQDKAGLYSGGPMHISVV